MNEEILTEKELHEGLKEELEDCFIGWFEEMFFQADDICKRYKDKLSPNIVAGIHDKIFNNIITNGY
jgi:hypothetical protein